MITPNDLKRKVLRESGLEQFQPEPKKPRLIHPRMVRASINMPKTPLMKYLEHKYGKPIQDVLTSGSLSIVARTWGNEVDVSTVSRWIKRFRLRYTKDNLPSCTYCEHHTPECDLGICVILVNLERYDLLMIKKDEIMKCLNQQG